MASTEAATGYFEASGNGMDVTGGVSMMRPAVSRPHLYVRLLRQREKRTAYMKSRE